MHQLEDIVATSAHSSEPLTCEGSKLRSLPAQPGVNGRITLADLGVGAPSVGFNIETTLKNIPLSAAVTETAEEMQQQEIADFTITSPLDSFAPVLTMKTLFIRYSIAGLLRREIEEILGDLGITLQDLSQYPDAPEVVEDGDTFEANALAKARQAAVACGLPALADDSGLEVDALAGAPGVYSARYAGEPADDVRNNAKLLDALDGVTPDRRRARFRCAAAFVDPARGLELVRMGEVAGEILTAPRGTGGFGSSGR